MTNNEHLHAISHIWHCPANRASYTVYQTHPLFFSCSSASINKIHFKKLAAQIVTGIVEENYIQPI